MLQKCMSWLVVLAAVSVLGWQAHDWMSPHAAVPPAPQKVYVPVQAPDDPFRGFNPTSSENILDQQYNHR